ncbi:hypothetical protein AM493_14420 [Flavobacterium akiainvivens]|uniref:Glycosyltransferase RgtA/B/C/D-like domain-containing protein n=1 Tax=Flavobacterium akiainvivens TaxID=1202724 RepID=A0A0M8MJI6_9FLAO|nr:hypothetical protein [Flavobacterium akiainvivens]KOS07097.1 hypothetical protein AM493_14420 [Flavobacterium akiainvivens]SFQ75604.1 hypothetical protein SAMN05444144_12214 [Flavobacterium akiainvivens]
MAYTVKKNHLIFLLLAIFGWLLSIALQFVMPDRFLGDANTITTGIVEEGLVGGYEISTLIYRITLLGKLPYPIVALIQFPVYMYILYKIGIPDDFHMLNVKNVIVYLAVIIIAVFIAMPSKEFITYVFIAIVIYIFKNSRISYMWSIILSSLLLAVFAVFRIYFCLIPVLAMCMYAVTFVKLKNKTLATYTYGLLIIIFMSLSYGILKGEFLTESTRGFVNSDRSNALASNSIIVSPLPLGTWYGEIVSILHGFFSVNLPVNGLKHILSPQILAFIIWQVLLFYILLVRFSWALKNRFKYRYEIWALLLLFSYFIVQGVFEPDLGSAVKHKVGLFPLIYYCLYYENSRTGIS